MSTVAAVAIWVLACLLAACADYNQAEADEDVLFNDPCDKMFYIREGFTPEQRKAIARAAMRWNAIANEQFCVTADNESEGAEIRRIAQAGEEYASFRDYFGTDFAGVHWRDATGKDTIAVRDDVQDLRWMEAVALHEFGHAHGLGHVAGKAIMNAFPSQEEIAEDFTDLDIAECKRVGACD